MITVPRKNGFTLIESLVAITVLTLAVAGPLTAASRAVVAAQIAQSQLTASYLAQEGIEYMRQMRDDEYLTAFSLGGNGISAAAWDAFLNGSTGSDPRTISGCSAADGSVTCTLDPTRSMGTGTGLSLMPCSGGSCDPLYLANGVYTEQSNISGSVKTVFVRTIQAVPISPTDLRIVSTVRWTNHNASFAVTVTDHLTPWQ